MSAALLAVDAERRNRITAAETAQADQRKASKEVGAAKGRGDEAEFQRLRALVAEKKAEIAAAGIILPEDIDDELFVTLFGMGSTKAKAGSEMEAIRAANFLTNNDPHGGEWIRTNKLPPKAGEEGRGRGGRAGGRRRRA